MRQTEPTYSFGDWVQQRRKALDLTQRQLAERVACSLSTIKKIERDARRPSLQVAALLAAALQLPEAEQEKFLRSARGISPVDRLAPARAMPLVGVQPTPATTFHGRKKELARLAERLVDPTTRLLTITGPGGAGKTRLALEASRLASDHFPDSFWFVALAGISESDRLPATIATACELTFAGPEPPLEQLIGLLRGKRSLLLLDNFEQLLPDGAELLAQLLPALPETKLLVTSRERLHLQAEVVLPIAGVELWAAQDIFRERARRADATLTLDAEDEAAIAAICRLLEGLPLAVELAASWVRLLSPSAIHRELEQNITLLAAELHDLAPRHRNMQAVLTTSWNRLTVDEQQLLARLSVFAGGFSAAAAIEVCDATLPLLAALQNHSLLQREGERFSLHALVRQYASARLEQIAASAVETSARHADYYTSLLSRLSHAFAHGGPELDSWRQRIELEIDNIEAAWARAIEKGHLHLLLPASLALYHYLDVRGLVVEGERHFSRMAAVASRTEIGDKTLQRRAQAMALTLQAAFGMRQGKQADGRRQTEEAFSLLQGLDASVERMVTHNFNSVIHIQLGKLEAAQESAEKALALARKEGHLWGQALALNLAGLVHLMQKRADTARELLVQAVEVWEKRLRVPFGKARALVHLGLAHLASGEPALAAATEENALALARQIHDPAFIAISECNLGFARYKLGELEAAEAAFVAGLDDARRYSLLPSMLHAILGLGLVAAAQGRATSAVTILAFGLSEYRPAAGILLGEPQRVLADLRAELPPALFAKAEARARQMDLPAMVRWLQASHVKRPPR